MDEKKSFNEILIQLDEVKHWIDENSKDLSKDDRSILRIKTNGLLQQTLWQKILVASLIASPLMLFFMMTYVYWANYNMLVMIDQKIAINSLSILLSAENRIEILLKSLADLKAQLLSIKSILILIPIMIVVSVALGLIIRFFIHRKKKK